MTKINGNRTVGLYTSIVELDERRERKREQKKKKNNTTEKIGETYIPFRAVS